MKHRWEHKKLGEICKVLDSKRKPVTKKDRKTGEYPYYGAMGIQDYVDNYIFDGDYLLVGEDGAKWGANDKTAFQIHGKCWVNNHAHILQINQDIVDTSFVEHYLVGKDLSSYITGAVVPKLTQASLVSIPIPIPPLPVQEQICSLLDKMNRVIEAKKEQLKELDNLAQAIFYDMFGDPVTNEKGWETKQLGDTGEIVSGSTPSTTDATNWDGNINWVTPAELNDQLFYGSTQRKLTEKGASGLTLMPTGTVLLSSRAPIGKLAITTEPMCCNQGFKNIVCGNKLNNIFLYYYLRLTMDNVKALGVGATFKEVSKKAISAYPIILPPLPLQQAFAEKVEAIEQQKELINQSLREVQTLFDSRMDYWFSEEDDDFGQLDKLD